MGQPNHVPLGLLNGVPGNEGKTFTLDRLTFASSVAAIAEPSSTMTLGLVATGVKARRRRCRAEWGGNVNRRRPRVSRRG